MKFPCIACGLCCRKARLIPHLAQFINQNGICSYLDIKTNDCTIYKNRPNICNIHAMYELYFKNEMTETEYILRNLQACYELNIEAGHPDAALKIQHYIYCLHASLK